MADMTYTNRAKTLKSALLLSSLMIPFAATPAAMSAALTPQDAEQEQQEKVNPFRVDLDAIEEVVVQGQFIPDEKRNTSEVSNVLDATALARAGDSDIAVALSRVTGLSLVQGKYVFVRGLGDRYSSARLDGSSLASPEPLKRVVPLDIFPTALLEEAMVQKTYSPEFPAEFGGGVINLRSKAVPEEFFMELQVGGNYNTESTCKNGLTYDGPGSEWTTFGGGLRNLPTEIKNAIATSPQADNAFAHLTDDQLAAAGKSLPDVWNINQDKNKPNMGVEFSLGNSYDVGEGRLGFIAAVTYDTSQKNKKAIRRTYGVSNNGLVLNENIAPEVCQSFDGAGDDCGFFSTEQEFSLNAILSVGYEIDADNALKATSILLRKSTKEAAISKGEFSSDPGTLQTKSRLDWVETQLWSNQLSGDHTFAAFGDSDTFFDTNFKWRVNHTITDRDAPFRRQYNYTYFDFAGVDRMSARPDGNRTSYGALDDKSYEFGFDILQPMTLADKAVDVKLGFTYLEKDRASAFRRFGFDFPPGAALDLRELTPDLIFSDENIFPGGFEIVDYTDESDAFTAALKNYQWYAGIDMQVTDKLRAAVGWRFEESDQNTFTIDRLTEEPLLVQQKGSFQLPAATLTYEFADNLQIRGGFSQTVSRPDLRELSSAFFLDSERDSLITGNPNLMITEINNYDLRFEWYFGLGESFTVGAFFKEFSNPIERVFGFQGETPFRTFENAESAEIYGLEVEIEKSLDLQTWFGWEWLGDTEVFIKGNASYIDSEISLSEDQQNRATNLTRPLQGQSKYLANLQVGWEDYMDGEKFTLALNYTGSRIYDVGIQGAPDIIDTPPLMLKAVYKREFQPFGKPLELSIKADNILNEKFELTQGGEIYEQYDLGTTFSLSFKYKF